MVQTVRSLARSWSLFALSLVFCNMDGVEVHPRSVARPMASSAARGTCWQGEHTSNMLSETTWLALPSKQVESNKQARDGEARRVRTALDRQSRHRGLQALLTLRRDAPVALAMKMWFAQRGAWEQSQTSATLMPSQPHGFFVVVTQRVPYKVVKAGEESFNVCETTTPSCCGDDTVLIAHLEPLLATFANIYWAMYEAMRNSQLVAPTQFRPHKQLHTNSKSRVSRITHVHG